MHLFWAYIYFGGCFTCLQWFCPMFPGIESVAVANRILACDFTTFSAVKGWQISGAASQISGFSLWRWPSQPGKLPLYVSWRHVGSAGLEETSKISTANAGMWCISTPRFRKDTEKPRLFHAKLFHTVSCSRNWFLNMQPPHGQENAMPFNMFFQGLFRNPIFFHIFEPSF